MKPQPHRSEAPLANASTGYRARSDRSDRSDRSKDSAGAADRGQPDPGAGGDGPPALRPAWVEVHLERLERNLERLRQRVKPAAILAVVKADAYGHGAAEVSRCLEACGVEGLAVALLEEGATIRRAGVASEILVLGPIHPDQMPLTRRYRLTPTLSSLEQIRRWSAWTSGESLDQDVQLKIDTGMTRLGVSCDEVETALSLLRQAPRLRLRGVLSHLAEAEDLSSPETAEQTRRFEAALDLLSADERAASIVHLANSAAGLHHPETRYGGVRFGLALYGLDPAASRATHGCDLEPVMEVRARLTAVRQVPAGTRLGYGGRRVTVRPARIGVIPIGYADGYSWRLSDRSDALVGDRRAPIAGTVSMDMTLVDLTEVGGETGDLVVLLGRQGGESIGARELAEIAGTLPYEILCSFGLRLPRRYLRDGVVVAQGSRLYGDRR